MRFLADYTCQLRYIPNEKVASPLNIFVLLSWFNEHLIMKYMFIYSYALFFKFLNFIFYDIMLREDDAPLRLPALLPTPSPSHIIPRCPHKSPRYGTGKKHR